MTNWCNRSSNNIAGHIFYAHNFLVKLSVRKKIDSRKVPTANKSSKRKKRKFSLTKIRIIKTQASKAILPFLSLSLQHYESTSNI